MLLRDSILAMTALILFNFAVFSLFPGLASHGNTNHGPATRPRDLSKGQPTEGILNHWSYCLLASET